MEDRAFDAVVRRIAARHPPRGVHGCVHGVGELPVAGARSSPPVEEVALWGKALQAAVVILGDQERAVGVEPDPESVFYLGVAAVQDWHLPAVARRAFRQGIALGDGVSAFNLGVLLHEEGDRDGAVAAYQQVRELGLDG